MTMTMPPAAAVDRRPIAARDRRVFQRLAAGLARAGVSPDSISLAGLGLGIAAGATLAATAWWPAAATVLWVTGAVLVQLRLLANLLDGMVAVESGVCSALGNLYNEIPDRVSDAATLVGLGFAAGGHPLAGLTAACLAVFVAYVRAEGRATTGHGEFCGPMAKPHRMFAVTVVAVYMALAPAAWTPALATGPGLPAAALATIAAGCVWTAARRLRRIAIVARSGHGG